MPRGFGPVPGWAARVEFTADDPLPAEPGLPGRHNRENAAAATAAARAAGIPDDAIAEALRTFPGVAAPARARRRDRRRPLRQRLEGDEHRRGPARARLVRRAAARDPRRLAEGRELRRARARAPRSRLPDRRDCGRARRRRSTARASRTSAAATSSPQSSAAAPTRRGRARSSCSRRPARATTSSATSSSAARNSGGWCRTYPGEARPPGVERPRPRHARPRRLRDGDGVQRDLGLGDDRRREPDLLPEAAGDLRAPRARAARRRAPVELPVAAPHRARCSSWAASSCSWSRSSAARTSTAPAGGSTSAPRSFQPSEIAKLAVVVWIALYLSKRPVPTHARRADEADRADGGRVLRARARRARPRHRDRDLPRRRRDAAGRGRTGAAARRVGRDRLGRHGGRDLVRAVPAHTLLQLRRPVARRAGGRLPDGAGDDRDRFGRRLRQGARRERRQGLLPPRGAHGHDLRDHRRGARDWSVRRW